MIVITLYVCTLHFKGLDQPPITMAAYLNDLAFFTCYIRQSMPAPRLFFFVNSTPVSSLPARYEAQSFSSNPIDGMGTNLTLQIRALKETNNSLIVCGVDVTGRIDRDYFPSPALLLVQGIYRYTLMHMYTRACVHFYYVHP